MGRRPPTHVSVLSAILLTFVIREPSPTFSEKIRECGGLIGRLIQDGPPAAQRAQRLREVTSHCRAVTE